MTDIEQHNQRLREIINDLSKDRAILDEIHEILYSLKVKGINTRDAIRLIKKEMNLRDV